eukprot:CAMPEP_0177390782 /NCGR_PEP_ID=MMETSP0368-20130122/53383_1 /TAXON_ID=447022 ORGANISM="Scrippsiella hangoei-like, Strain SHHI-4" /NCGR_SAMPLE_ID=MMETSP0368 /ASSEMBLY_ACC=CAM_ASM_000363 /LENGTH=64 /DNA_ID=CAMNT_0018856485 /DNA_START=20 /DNA_END=211 /DNA_ORIENTATION=+
MAPQRLFALFLCAVAAAAVPPEECLAGGSALLQTASKINSDALERHGTAPKGEKSEAVKKVDLG